MNIEAYMKENPQYAPIMVLIPEDCAEVIKKDSGEVFHVFILDGVAHVEPYTEF